jgi:hypothetical protein
MTNERPFMGLQHVGSDAVWSHGYLTERHDYRRVDDTGNRSVFARVRTQSLSVDPERIKRLAESYLLKRKAAA